MSEEEKKIEEEIEEVAEVVIEEEEVDEVDEDAEAAAEAAKIVEKPPVDDKPERFELAQPEKPSEEDTVEIIHNGQPYHLTKDKIIELAQKGFDYDVKVGPHGKLVQMVDADPELAKTINDYWQKKISGEPSAEGFKIKPITEYEDEAEWLQDNIQQAFESFKPTAPSPAPPATNATENALKMRDPEHAQAIIPKLGAYASRLSVADYQRVDSDMGALCQFYDFVKKQELTKTVSPKPTPTPGFKVKSGGGDAPRSDSTALAWTLSKDEFQKQLDKVKGFG